MTRTLALTLFALALLGLPAVALAQGPPADKAPDHAGDQGPPDHAGDQGPPDHAEASDEEATGSQAEASEPSPATTGSPDGDDATSETAPDEEKTLDQADDEPDATSTDEEAPIEEGPSTDDEATETVDEESAGDTVSETTETVARFAASTTAETADDAEDGDEDTSQSSASTVDATSPDPDLDAQDDAGDEPGEADVAEEPDASDEPDTGPGTVAAEASLVQDRAAWNPSASPSLPAPGADIAAEGGPGAAWAGSMPGASIGWLLPSLAIGAVGALALVRARTRPAEPAEPVKGTRTPPEPAPEADDEIEAEPSTAELPEPGLEGVLLLGQRALDQGDLEAAVGWFETAIAISPGQQTAHFCMGMCLDELGRLEQAADALDNAIELEPGDPLARYVQAGVLAQMGRTGEALEHARRLARDSPGFREAMAEDEAFANLGDHPRFLALIGEL